MGATNFLNSLFKNSLLYVSGRLPKIRSVHTNVIPRTVYFVWTCKARDLETCKAKWEQKREAKVSWILKTCVCTLRKSGNQLSIRNCLLRVHFHCTWKGSSLSQSFCWLLDKCSSFLPPSSAISPSRQTFLQLTVDTTRIKPFSTYVLV